METLILDVNQSQIKVFVEMAKALNISYLQINEENEDKAILKAMEEAKDEGYLSEIEKSDFISSLGK